MEPLKSEWLSYSWPYCGNLLQEYSPNPGKQILRRTYFLLFCSSRKLLNSGQEEDHHCNYGAQTYHHDRRTREVCQHTCTKILAKTQEILLSARCSPINVSAMLGQRLPKKGPIPSVKEGWGCTRILAKLSKNSFEYPTFLNSRESVSANAV